MTQLAIIDRTVNETNRWLHELVQELGCTEQHAYHVLRAGLHTLRDRLTPEEAVHLSAQLPLLVRGIYFEDWRPADTPEKTRDRDAFLARLESRLNDDEPQEPEAAARAVFAILKRNCEPGELGHVAGQLPGEIEALYRAA